LKRLVWEDDEPSKTDWWNVGIVVLVVFSIIMFGFVGMRARKLMQRLNQLFESEVEIPRIRHEKTNTLSHIKVIMWVNLFQFLSLWLCKNTTNRTRDFYSHRNLLTEMG